LTFRFDDCESVELFAAALATPSTEGRNDSSLNDLIQQPEPTGSGCLLLSEVPPPDRHRRAKEKPHEGVIRRAAQNQIAEIVSALRAGI
jgi:hypothetical protein